MVRKRGTPRRGQSFQFEYWREVIGIGLLGLALVTLLSILSADRGALTEGWLGVLGFGFGWGMYFIPVLLGGLGFWVVFGAFSQDAWLPGAKVLAAVALYLLFLGFLGILAPAQVDPVLPQEPRDMGAGGYIGMTLGETFTAGVGRLGALLVLVFLMLVSTSVLLGASPVRIVSTVGAAWQSLVDWYRIRRLSLNDGNGGGLSTSRSGLPPASPRDDEASRAKTAPRSAVVLGERSGLGLRSRDEVISFLPSVVGGRQRWELPALDQIFDVGTEHEISQAEIRTRVKVIEDTLASFGVPARVIEVNQGPAVTQFGVEPGYVEQKLGSGRVKRSKVKVSKISGLANDLALALAASPIRIEAPVPGRSVVGIEVPNMEKSLVSLRSVMETETFTRMKSSLKIALGQDVSGQAYVADLAAMPHLLIAGATGSGKSVAINAMAACLLCQNTPDDLRLIMVDPKMVELTAYNGIPHLLSPVVVELEKVVDVLHWTTQEMNRRYRLFSKAGTRNLESYNAGARLRGETPLPKIVVIIDELADLMMVAPDQVERSICRIAQMARATGIHLVIATQRPSVDVITGLIKANFPARISFAVTSQVDSRVIIDGVGAERLLGRGDMLFMSPDSSKLVRLQGCYVSDAEIIRLVRYWKWFRPVAPMGRDVSEEMVQQPLWEDVVARAKAQQSGDDLLDEAIEIVQQCDRASASLLQRRLRVGYSRAARLIDLMEEKGIVGPDPGGGRSREVLAKGSTGPPRHGSDDEDPPP